MQANAGGSVDFAGGRMHKARDARGARGLEQIECAGHVGFNVGVRCLIRKRNGDQRGQVADGVQAHDRLCGAMWIANVAGNHVKLVSDFRCDVIQPAPVVEGVVLDECTHVVASANQRFGEMRADESIRASDENLHGMHLNCGYRLALPGAGMGLDPRVCANAGNFATTGNFRLTSQR